MKWAHVGRASHDIAVIEGLFTATALSLFVVPTVYTLLDDCRQWLSRRLRERCAAQEPASAELSYA